jgi:hypothetical protein
MGDVRLARARHLGRDLVVAFLSSGQPVWGMDATTREQWWYAPEHAIDDVRDAIAAGLSGLGTGVDLTSHAPGHLVLAEIARRHAQAAPTEDGMPGALSDDIVPWCLGFVGEEHVGALLAALGPDWRVLHAVPVATAGVTRPPVIGPGGVYTHATRPHASQHVEVEGDGTFVAGRFVDHVADARTDAAHADAALAAVGGSLRVRPVVVTVGARLRVAQPQATWWCSTRAGSRAGLVAAGRAGPGQVQVLRRCDGPRSDDDHAPGAPEPWVAPLPVHGRRGRWRAAAVRLEAPDRGAPPVWLRR